MKVPKLSFLHIRPPRKLATISGKQKIYLAAVILLCITLLPTLYAAKTIQDIRSEAGQKKAIVSCENISIETVNTEVDPTQTPQLIAQAQSLDKKLDQTIREYMKHLKQEEKEKKKGKKEKQKEKKRDREREQKLKKEIKRLAMDRKKAVIELLYADPTNVLNLSKGDKQKEGYYLLEKNCKVSPQKIQGELVISIAENPRAKTFKEFYEIVTANGDDYAVHNASEAFFENMEPESTVSIDGLVIDNEIILESPKQSSVKLISPPQNSDIGAERKNSGGSSNARISGKQRILVIFAHFSNNSPPSIMKNNEGKYLKYIENFYNKVPNNTASASIDRTGWIEIPKALRNKCGLYSRNILRKIINEADKKVNYNKYDHIVITAPFGGNACRGTVGYGTIGKKRVKTADGHVKLSISRVDAHNEVGKGLTQAEAVLYMSETAVHEMGHGYGLYHADALICDIPSNLDHCSVSSYDDWFDQMGLAGGMFNSPHLNYLGWLSSKQLQTVTEGTYTLSPLTDRAGTLKAVRIPRGPDDYLYIEFRQPINPDETFRDTYVTWTDEPVNVYNGALLHLSGRGKRHSNRIRGSLLILPPVTTEFSQYYSFAKPALEVGKSFIDDKTGTMIFVKSLTQTGLTVEIYPQGKHPSPMPVPTIRIFPTTTPTPTISVVKPSLTPTIEASPSAFPTASLKISTQ